MMKSYNDMLTLSLLGGGANNNNCLLNEKKDNYDIESLRDQTLFIVVIYLPRKGLYIYGKKEILIKINYGESG